jgi:hypothetical protein
MQRNRNIELGQPFNYIALSDMTRDCKSTQSATIFGNQRSRVSGGDDFTGHRSGAIVASQLLARVKPSQLVSCLGGD